MDQIDSLIQIRTYGVRHHLLKNLVKCFWVVVSDRPMHYKLIPVNSIDIVLNFSAPISYTSTPSHEFQVKGCHFTGIRTQSSLVQHRGTLDMIGISFFPLGFYPFLKIPLSEFTDTTIELELLNKEFIERVADQFTDTLAIEEKFRILEHELVRFLDIQRFPPQDIAHFIYRFSSPFETTSIPQLCENHGIHPRTLERRFQTYVGIRPKLFQRITRFQYALKNIMMEKSSRLTTVAHDHEYYDQSHFIKEFKEFTGCSPSRFLQNSGFVKQILDYQ